jgi:hypothetical protein
VHVVTRAGVIRAVFAGFGPPPADGRRWQRSSQVLIPGDLARCDNLSAGQVAEFAGSGTKCDNLSAPPAEQLSQPGGGQNEISRT